MAATMMTRLPSSMIFLASFCLLFHIFISNHDNSRVLAFTTTNTAKAKVTSLASSSSSSSSSLGATKSLVWLTGHEDLRLNDHGGFVNALLEAKKSNVKTDDTNTNNESHVIVPVFVLDPKIHLKSKSTASVARLYNCLVSLEKEIASLTTTTTTSSASSSSSLIAPLMVREGQAAWVIPSLANEIKASSCHVIDDDVVSYMRQSQRLTCKLLHDMDVKVHRWSDALRPTAPWAASSEVGAAATAIMPSFFPDYCNIADMLPVESTKNTVDLYSAAAAASFQPQSSSNNNNQEEQTMIKSDGVPPLSKLLDLARSATPSAVNEFRSVYSTFEPYEKVITDKWTTERGVQKALQEYCRDGKTAFANKYFIASDCAVPVSDGAGNNIRSKYAAAAARIVRGSSSPSEGMALREAPTRCFSSALSLGALSARDALDTARNRSPVTPPLWIGDGKKRGTTTGSTNKNLAGLFPSDNPLWGRSSEGSLSDVIEWREWFRLLAERSLLLQERGEPATSGGEKSMAGDPRELGTVNYWRWKDQHLVRYLTWPAGKDYDSKQHAPAMLLVHGFAASAEQWERLVYSLREQNTMDGKDTTPPIYAVDLLGFGHSEKPGLSYTQYLWESQIVDFAVEIMEAAPMIMVGNSIGGGLSAGAAASLGKKICKGLVLCNTAGVLESPETYSGYTSQNDDIRSHTQAAMEGNPNEPYSPVPILGGNGLDLFGTGIIKLIYPQIEQRLSLIYGNRIQNADPAVTYAIQQSAMHPGSANVIGSGQKLAPNRPLNEVLLEIDGGFNVLVVKGLEDQVSSPEVAKTRAELFSRLNPGKVIVDSIADAGHCPHDEQPAKVARSMMQWLATLKEDSMEEKPQSETV